MAESYSPLRPDSLAQLMCVPARSSGPLGVNDQGDPNRTTALGNTPGPLGVNDHADPRLDSIFSYAAEVTGSLVRSAEGIPVAVGLAVDQMKQAATAAEKQAGYEFFAFFFDHYLPRKLIHHYVYAKGADLTLTRKEMIDLNPAITVGRSRAFGVVLEELAAARKKGMPGMLQRQVEVQVLAAAKTNGTLGQFTVKMKGNLAYQSDKDWSYSGTMTFYDEWDFDPKDFSTGGRSLQGELKTRFAHYTLPGQGFRIYSEEAPFRQSSTDPLITWEGGTPSARLDKVGQADTAVASLDH